MEKIYFGRFMLLTMTLDTNISVWPGMIPSLTVVTEMLFQNCHVILMQVIDINLSQ